MVCCGYTCKNISNIYIDELRLKDQPSTSAEEDEPSTLADIDLMTSEAEEIYVQAVAINVVEISEVSSGDLVVNCLIIHY